ncbi:MAG: stalk domain-containing protein [Candidatus Velthaea sp.]|jgi:hypothetical protein
MRLSPTAIIVAFAAVVLSSGVSSAATVTIDGAPVTGTILHEGHLMVPFRAPMQQIGATVVWTDKVKTGVASAQGHELIRTAIGSKTVVIKGAPKVITVAPALIEPQHLEYIPVEILPQISRAKLTFSPDRKSAVITNFDLGGVAAAAAAAAAVVAAAAPAPTAAATAAPAPVAAAPVVAAPVGEPVVTDASGFPSVDPDGKILLVWVWLLPISAAVAGFAYFAVIGQVERKGRRNRTF